MTEETPMMLHRLGTYAATRPWRVLTAWVLAAALVAGAAALWGGELKDNLDVPGLDSTQATALLVSAGADEAGLTAQVVATPRDGGRLDQAVRVELASLRTRLAALPHVLSVQETVESPDGTVALLTLQYPGQELLAPSDLVALKDAVATARQGGGLTVELGGDLSFAFEPAPTGRGELIGLACAVLILLFAFGSVLAAGLPIVVAVFGLAVSVGLMTLVTRILSLPTWAPSIGAMIGLGVGIDYALFILVRHREHLATGLSVPESVGRALSTAGRSVVLAGGIVTVSLVGLTVARVPFITAGGLAISLLVGVMVLASVTLLPALLGLLGHRVLSRRPAGVGRGWVPWITHVCRHPAAYAVGVSVLLLALAAPALSLRTGTPDAGTLSDSRSERRAYDLLATGFGPGVNGPLVIAVDPAGDRSLPDRIRDRVAADPGIASVAAAEGGARVVTLVAYPTTAPDEAATYATVKRLRTEAIPAAVAGGPGRAHVGGQTVAFADVADRIGERLPLFVTVVVALAFLLLVVVFRSVLVPLKAALLNLLAIAASYGVLVLVFQKGWGANLIGVESTLPVVSFVPLFMFAILFGLSMDYEVFLLSRVREEHLAGQTDHDAVVRGIASTGRVITSAALIMVSVFGAFVLGSDPTIKMFGLGLATAVLLDATLVRMVLVPATMTLLGSANWWLPDWLDRLLPGAQAHLHRPVDVGPGPGVRTAGVAGPLAAGRGAGPPAGR